MINLYLYIHHFMLQQVHDFYNILDLSDGTYNKITSIQSYLLCSYCTIIITGLIFYYFISSK